ncbi:hypothetical protein [Clostridium culturomicium]|uniref:hypothetical protein n=1 Tax=Clostridium culturomicium TaxID=1499683 RepID=UPI00058EB5AF|nr:hypothetical protein [Clostridium culturomicium]
MATISDQFKIYDNISKQLDSYNRILKSTINVNVPTYDFKIITESINPFTAQLNLISNQFAMINSSIQPFQDYMNSINKIINQYLEATTPKFNFEYLNNLKILSSFTPDDLEYIDETSFINTVDEIYTNINDFDTTNDSVELNEYTSCFLSLKQLIQNSSLTWESFRSFIALLITIFTVFQPYLDNSSEIMIEQQQEIIELEKQKLDLCDDISDSLKNIDNSCCDITSTLENINNSLETLIESINH